MITKKYQHQPSAIASYDYTDIAEGTGMVKFYLYSGKTDGGLDEHLGRNVLYSYEISKSKISVPGGGYTKYEDNDYDLSAFVFPQTIKGTGILSIPCLVSATASSVMYLIVKVRKWDGTTETEIASVQTETMQSSGTEKRYAVVMPITIPVTTFKAGETLRLTVEMWANGNGQPLDKVYYFIDPKDRTSSSMHSTISFFLCPFRIGDL